LNKDLDVTEGPWFHWQILSFVKPCL